MSSGACRFQPWAAVRTEGTGIGRLTSQDRVSGTKDHLRGILWMIASVVAFTAMGLVIKHLSSQVELAIIVLFRQWVVLLILVPWLIRSDAPEILTQRLGTHTIRALLALSSFACFAYAVGKLILADATALTFTSPLWSILVSVIFLGEPVRIRRWTATVIGFVGVLFIVKPTGNVAPAMLVALAGAICVSLSMMLVKKLSTTESPHQILFYFTVVGSLASLGPGIYFWQTPSPGQWMWLISIGVAGFAGQMCIARAIALAEVTIVAPVDFLRLPLAVVAGFFLFAEIPDRWTVIGIITIALASIYIATRETALRRPGEGGEPDQGSLPL
jgi:drug/metabolite transporter (DMT)-like permease